MKTRKNKIDAAMFIINTIQDIDSLFISLSYIHFILHSKRIHKDIDNVTKKCNSHRSTLL